MRKALIDNEGQVVNVVVLADDVTEWDGYQAIPLDDDDPVGPGWRRDGDTFTYTPPTVDPTPTLEDRLAELEDQVRGMRAAAAEAAATVTGGAKTVAEAVARGKQD